MRTGEEQEEEVLDDDAVDDDENEDELELLPAVSRTCCKQA